MAWCTADVLGSPVLVAISTAAFLLTTPSARNWSNPWRTCRPTHTVIDALRLLRLLVGWVGPPRSLVAAPLGSCTRALRLPPAAAPRLLRQTRLCQARPPSSACGSRSEPVCPSAHRGAPRPAAGACSCRPPAALPGGCHSAGPPAAAAGAGALLHALPVRPAELAAGAASSSAPWAARAAPPPPLLGGSPPPAGCALPPRSAWRVMRAATHHWRQQCCQERLDLLPMAFYDELPCLQGAQGNLRGGGAASALRDGGALGSGQRCPPASVVGWGHAPPP
jgi:hypothetical protein